MLVIDRRRDLGLLKKILVGKPRTLGQVVVIVIRRLARIGFRAEHPGFIVEKHRPAVHPVGGVSHAVIGAHARTPAERMGVGRVSADVIAGLFPVRTRNIAGVVIGRIGFDVVRIAEGILPRQAELLPAAVSAADAESQAAQLAARQPVTVNQVVGDVVPEIVVVREVAAAVHEADVVVREFVVGTAKGLVVEQVILHAERRAHHQRMAVVEFVVETRIEAVVDIFDPRIGRAVVQHQLFRRGEGLPVGQAFVAVVGPVEEIAGRNLGLFAPLVAVVRPHGLHRRDAVERPHHEVAAAAAGVGLPLLRRPQNILGREILHIDIVHQRDDRQPPRPVEDIDIAAADIFVGDSVPGEQAAESAAPLVGLRHDIDGRIAVADVHARKFRLVALRIVDVDAFDHIGRNVADCRHHVVAEKFAPVHEHPLHGPALRFDNAVGHLQPRHLADQRPGVGSERDFVGRGPVAQRIAANRRSQRRHLQHHALDRFGAGRHLQRSEIGFPARSPQLALQSLVSE